MSLYPQPPFDARPRSHSSELSHWQHIPSNHNYFHDLENRDLIRSHSYLPYYQDTSQRPYQIPSTSYSPSLSTVSNHSSVDDWGNTLYSIDENEDINQPSYVSPEPAIKAEPEENFIMELRTQSRQLNTPSNNVPLRATHACEEMLAMMGVFRLDPFVVRGAAWKPEANTGLDRSPVMFEFTLDLPEEVDYEKDSDSWPPNEEDEEEEVEYSPELDYPESECCSDYHDYRNQYSQVGGF